MESITYAKNEWGNHVIIVTRDMSQVLVGLILGPIQGEVSPVNIEFVTTSLDPEQLIRRLQDAVTARNLMNRFGIDRRRPAKVDQMVYDTMKYS